MLEYKAPSPLAVFQLPVVLEYKAPSPLAVFQFPVVLEYKADDPFAVFVDTFLHPARHFSAYTNQLKLHARLLYWRLHPRQAP